MEMNVPKGFRLLDIFNPGKSTAKFIRKCSRSKSCVELVVESSLNRKDGAALIQQGVEKLKGKPINPQSFRVTKTFKTKIDLDTLKPFEASTRTAGRVDIDGKAQDFVEEHEHFYR